MKRFIPLAAGVLLLIVSSGFPAAMNSAAAQEDGVPMILPVDPDPLVIETADGLREFTVEIADEDAERARGLMFRSTLAPRHGMLFVFERTRRLGFWMKNTPLPLDLVFIDDRGHIRDILPGEPFSTALIAPADEARFVLEVEAGTADEAGVAIGDRVRHPRIDDIADAQ